MRLDWILPAYNPPEGWELEMLQRLKEVMSERPEWQIALYIATDGSVRGHSSELRNKLKQDCEQVFLIDYKENKGKGFALRSAVAQCTAPYILYTDYDLPFTKDSYIAVLDALERGADVVLPQRDRKQYTDKLSPMRKILSGGSILINRLLLGLPARDTQAGLKAFNRRGADVFLSTTIERFLFDSEFIALSVRAHLNIVTTFCRIRSDIQLSSMGLQVLKSEFHNIPKLIRARWFS